MRPHGTIIMKAKYRKFLKSVRRLKPKRGILWTVTLSVVVTLLIVNLWGPDKKIWHQVEVPHGVGSPQFLRDVSGLVGSHLVAGNRIVELLNGEEIFPAMLEAVREAKRSIAFETYIFWGGQLAQELTDAFCERARAGVAVHVLLDWVGSAKMHPDMIRQMEEAGIELLRFRPPTWYRLDKFNHRDHRKLMVVDGKVGFTGGAGIADHWLGDADSPEEWRDTHFRVEGPAVAQMQTAFLDNWLEASSNVLQGDAYFPELGAAGSSLVQVLRSSVDESSPSIHLLYLYTIAAARERILIASAYFVPDILAVEMLVGAHQRGVDVEIIVPGRIIDTEITRRASRSTWGRLLEAGVAIYEYQPTMFHSKVMIVDDRWVLLGSSNFDDRSFELNDEINLNVYDREFAAKNARTFEEDKKHSRRITFEEWKNRPVREKLIDFLASLFRRQL